MVGVHSRDKSRLVVYQTVGLRAPKSERWIDGRVRSDLRPGTPAEGQTSSRGANSRIPGSCIETEQSEMQILKPLVESWTSVGSSSIDIDIPSSEVVPAEGLLVRVNSNGPRQATPRPG